MVIKHLLAFFNMKNYIIEVTRTAWNTMSFNVEAKNKDQAEEIALEIAGEADWGYAGAEYEIESTKQVKLQ